MALSKQEQGVLDEIERGLREDPSFTAGLDPLLARRRTRRRAMALAVAGLLLVVLGEMVAMSQVVTGVILAVCGFLTMMIAFTSSSHRWRGRWSR